MPSYGYSATLRATKYEPERMNGGSTTIEATK